jgi:hypothetical protein
LFSGKLFNCGGTGDFIYRFLKENWNYKQLKNIEDIEFICQNQRIFVGNINSEDVLNLKSKS